MTLTDLFVQVNSSFRGSDDDPPTAGTPDYTLWLATANRKLREYVKDGKAARQSLFEIRNIGTVSTGSPFTVDLDDDILLPADKVTIVTTADSSVDYVICKPQERDRFHRSCYISGRDPQVLTFVDDVVTGASIVGGAVNLAGFWVPDDLVSAGDTIPVDDPDWLVYATAAELSFNDLTYAAKYPELVAKANNLYSQMNSNNRRGTSGSPRTARTSVARITSRT